MAALESCGVNSEDVVGALLIGATRIPQHN